MAAGLTNLLGMVLEQNETIEKAEQTLIRMAASQTNRTKQPVYYITPPQTSRLAPSGVAPSATRDGVPIAVYNQIAADAVKEWPGNYNMQAYEIKNQIEAYRKLHP